MTESPADVCWSDRTGTGPPVVLVHGVMDRSSSFARVARRLRDHGEPHTVVRYDRRGYGRSLELGPSVGMDQQVDDLGVVIDDQPSIVFGHSYGGTIALAAAARGDLAIRGLVVYESPMPWMPWWPAGSAGAQAVADSVDPEDAAERFMRRMVGDERWERLPPSTRAARRGEGATMVAELSQVRPPHPPPFDLTSVRVPVVSARGENGAAHHHRSMREIADHVPDGVFRVVGGAGHGVHLSHAGAVADLVAELETRLR